MSDPRVLEENLRRLLTRAYAPVRPAPEFRRRLEANLRAARPGARVTRGRARYRRLAVLAAAAGVVAALFAWRLAPGGGAAPGERLEAILARGDVAWRPGAARDAEPAPWRALEPAEAAAGIELVDAAAELATPGDRAPGATAAEATPGAPLLRLRAEGGELAARAAGRAALARTDGGVVAQLERGRFEVACGPRAWWVETPHGAVRLERGVLDAFVVPTGARVRLLEGAARWVPADGSAGEPLAAGADAWLRGGRLEAPAPPTVVAELPPDDGREEVAPPAPAADPAIDPAIEVEPALGPRALGGRVRAAASGAPVTAFRVGLLPERVGNEIPRCATRAFESEGGTFVWDDLPAGRYDVYVHADGYACERAATVEVLEDAPGRELHAELRSGGEVTGWVVDAATGEPIAGAWVVSQSVAPAHGLSFDVALLQHFWLPTSTRTSADGRFRLEHVRAGEHELLVCADARGPAWLDVAVEEAHTADAGTLRLPAEGRVEGRVGGAAGEPRPGLQIVLTPTEDTHDRTLFGHATTDEDGRFAVGGLPGGVLLGILLENGGATPRVLPVLVEPGATARLDFSGGRAGTRLAGRLLDGEGDPVPNQNLALFDLRKASSGHDWIATTSDAEGAFRFEDLTGGDYALLRVDRDGAGLALADRLELPESGEVERTTRLATTRLEGRALDAVSGTPLAGASLVVERVEPEARYFAGLTSSDPDGRWSFDGFPAGTYVVTATTPGAPHAFETSPPLRLADRAVLAHDLWLDPGGVAVVRVVADGTPVAFAEVRILDTASGDACFDDYPATDDAGVYRSHGLPPGSYRVRVEREGFADAAAPLEIHVGRETEVRVTLTRSPTTPPPNPAGSAAEPPHPR